MNKWKYENLVGRGQHGSAVAERQGSQLVVRGYGGCWSKGRGTRDSTNSFLCPPCLTTFHGLMSLPTTIQAKILCNSSVPLGLRQSPLRSKVMDNRCGAHRALDRCGQWWRF